MADSRADLPYSAAANRNREPILAVLRELVPHGARVLEIGAGTGQHAVHFAAQLPGVVWQASEAPQNLAMLEPRLRDAGLAAPLALDVTQPDWPQTPCDVVYAANVVHIMGWPAVQSMFAGVGRLLVDGGLFCLYGPFNYDGAFTSDSNAAFDASLRARDPAMGLRDFAAVNDLARANGLNLQRDAAMPANNRLLVWGKRR